MYNKEQVGCGCLSIFALIAVSTLFRSCGEDAEDAEWRQHGAESRRLAESRRREESSTASESIAWLEGGTLNNVTAAEWRNGSQRNKVATCGGWMMVWAFHQKMAKSYKTDAETKVDAELLSSEIDSMITESAWRNADNITLVAVLAGSRLNLIKY